MQGKDAFDTVPKPRHVMVCVMPFCACSGMEADGTAYSAEDLQTMKDMGMNVTLTINEDGTASMNVFGEEMTGGSWDETSLTFEGQSIDMSVDGDTLTLSQGDEIMTFSRVDAAAAADAA